MKREKIDKICQMLEGFTDKELTPILKIVEAYYHRNGGDHE